MGMQAVVLGHFLILRSAIAELMNDQLVNGPSD